MRKIVVLCLALGVGLALAGAERWITPNPHHSYTPPEPIPGVFVEGPQVFMPALDTFRYDDNIVANAWARNRAGGGWGMKFISPSDNVTLAGALVNFYPSTWPVPGGTDAFVKVYADDGVGGSPGTLLWESETLTITRGQWNYVPINTAIVGHNFYIFHVQVDSYPMCPGSSIDAQNNAPAGRKWQYDGVGFGEDFTRGDWMIRAVLDWTPQTTNAAAVYFGSNMVRDTIPNINFQLKMTIRNLGSNALPQGTPCRYTVDGPQGYHLEDTMPTPSNLNHGQTQQMNFLPAWRIPNVPGTYRIKMWVEAAGEMWRADDTIYWELSAARWYEYANYNNGRYLTWAGPERATQFDPADFNLTYPVGLSRIRTQFYLHPERPWPDSTFLFRIYGDDGQTLVYESDSIEAGPGTPGPTMALDLDSMLLFTEGTFYVALHPVSTSGHPSTSADDTTNGHSFYGSPGGWIPWTTGELFISAALQGGVGLEEGFDPSIRRPDLRISGYPNPVVDQVTVRWQVPNHEPVSVNLYDATGRLVRNLLVTDKSRLGTLTLDAKTLATGIYLLRLETASGSATRKLVVER